MTKPNERCQWCGELLAALYIDGVLHGYTPHLYCQAAFRTGQVEMRERARAAIMDEGRYYPGHIFNADRVTLRKAWDAVGALPIEDLRAVLDLKKTDAAEGGDDGG